MKTEKWVWNGGWGGSGRNLKGKYGQITNQFFSLKRENLALVVTTINDGNSENKISHLHN